MPFDSLADKTISGIVVALFVGCVAAFLRLFQWRERYSLLVDESLRRVDDLEKSVKEIQAASHRIEINLVRIAEQLGIKDKSL